MNPLPGLGQGQSGEFRLEVHGPTGTGAAATGEILSNVNGFRGKFQVPSDGHYFLQDLPFGVYRLSLTAEGRAPRSDLVELKSELPLKLAITLVIAPISTQAEVDEELTLIDPAQTESVSSIG